MRKGKRAKNTQAFLSLRNQTGEQNEKATKFHYDHRQKHDDPDEANNYTNQGNTETLEINQKPSNP